ncbi:MAG: cache domain-containing protein, partial [Pseudomonadota bacterium]
MADAFFTARALERAAGPLSLYRETVVAELERFSHLTFVLARDPFVVATVQGADTGPLNQRLAEFAVRSGLEAIYLMNEAGLTIASSNADRPESFLGQNYSFRPYFQTAIKGGQGEFYGIGSTTGLPGYFFADPVKTQDNAALGVIAIKLGLTELEETWRAAGETVFLANKDGVILLSSRP